MLLHRLPPRWSIEESAACFVVRDGGKQALGYVYFANEPGRRLPHTCVTRLDHDPIKLNRIMV
jgi:hypothetical protein